MQKLEACIKIHEDLTCKVMADLERVAVFSHAKILHSQVQQVTSVESALQQIKLDSDTKTISTDNLYDTLYD